MLKFIYGELCVIVHTIYNTPSADVRALLKASTASILKEENMKLSKKILSVLLTVAMAVSITACSEGSGGGSGTNTDDGAGTSSTVGSFTEATAPPIDENAETGTIKYFTYETNFEDASAELIALFGTRYNGEIVVDATATSNTYFEMLGTRIATGDSPDMVRYEWISFPHGMSYNMFTPLDDYIDLDSDLWAGIKDMAENFAYNGKHFYVPHHIGTSFALNYNNRVLEENGLPDPMDMVQDNTWTWSAFEDMLKQWKDIDPVNHICYNGVGGMSFVATTGQKIIDIKDGQIINNLRNADIQRCMTWLEGLRKNGLLGATAEQQANGVSNGYVGPDAAFKDGNLLFLGMEPFWSFGAAKEAFYKDKATEDMKFVPFPRDEQADKYYQATDTFGYMIPAGAKNVKGVVDWITLLRTEEIDPDNLAKARDDAIDDSPAYYPTCPNADCGDTSENADSKGRHVYTEEEEEQGLTVCPVCGTPRREKFKAVWSEEQYDLYMEMRGEGDRFSLLFDNCYGFSSDVSALFQGGDTPIIDGPVFQDITYTNAVESLYSTVESYLQPYRDRMEADARGEEITTTPPQTE